MTGPDDEGFTLVELLMAMALFSVLGVMVLTTVLSTGRIADNSSTYNDLNEEARNVLNRFSREMREAQRIDGVVNAVGPGYSASADTSVTLSVDFDGDGTIEPSAADPEVLTYTYQRAQRRLVLTAAGSTVPVLAGNVETFKLSYYARISDSARLGLDGLTTASGGTCGSVPVGAVKDGELTWPELDADPTRKHGDCSGALGAAELPYLNSVGVELTVLKAPRQQHYRTRIDLRNNRA